MTDAKKEGYGRGDEVPGWFGPCAHGRDPYDRCGLCGELSGWAAKELAEAVVKLRGWGMAVPEFAPREELIGTSADVDALRAMAERLKAVRELPHDERWRWLQDNGLVP